MHAPEPWALQRRTWINASTSLGENTLDGDTNTSIFNVYVKHVVPKD